MAQKISSGNLFGRLGSGIGQGLAEQIPKEIEQYQLKSGLKDFSENSQGLDPMQQLAKIASVRGVTPQMIQSFSELAKQQNTKNAYARTGPTESRPGPNASPQVGDFDYRNGQVSAENRGIQQQPQAQPRSVGKSREQQSPNVPATAQGQPQVIPENPLDEKNLTRPPWKPAERDARVKEYINKGFLVDQAKDLAADDEARDLKEPEAYQKRREELSATQEKARAELKKKLETKLQKTAEGTFQDLTGEMQVNLERGMERDLRSNPKASMDDVVNDWSRRGLEMAKTKKQFDKTASEIGIADIGKGDQALNKLKSYSSIFKDADNSEEYFNLLKNKVGLSPGGAASIAYETSQPLNKYIKEYSPQKIKSRNYYDDARKNSVKTAIDLQKVIKNDDSVLSFVQQLKSKDPFFDEQAFFAQMTEDLDRSSLNDRQKREVAEGPRTITPYWGDILVFPWLGK